MSALNTKGEDGAHPVKTSTDEPVNMQKLIRRRVVAMLRSLLRWFAALIPIRLRTPVVAWLKRSREVVFSFLIGQDVTRSFNRSIEHEFLPLAQEITQTPPSPIRMGMGMAICLLFFTLLVIASFGSLDINAVAPARVQPVGRSKVIQPLYSGTVVDIHVQNGVSVKKGQTLVTLDSTEARAEVEAAIQHLNALRAEIIRRRTALAAVRENRFDVIPVIAFPASIDTSLQARETEMIEADFGKLISGLALQKTKFAENAAQYRALVSTISSRRKVIAVLRERLNIKSGLERDGWEARTSVLDAQETLEREQVNLTTEEGQLPQMKAAAETLKEQRAATIADFTATYAASLGTAERQRDDAAQDHVKAQSKMRFTILTAPVDGSVQQVAVTTVGQVVTSGQQLMVVVPKHAQLEIEALIDNKDIGFVKVGQAVIVKIDSYPFTRYGTLSGRVTRISRDAVESDLQQRSLGDTQQKPVSAEGSSASQTPKMANLVFPVVVTLDASTLIVDGTPTPIVPGMSASVEIQTGRRSVWEYIFSPLLKVVSESSHER